MKHRKTEYWDLFRASDDTFVKKIRKGECRIPDHLYHNTIEVIPSDMEGHMLLTRRALSKLYGDGKYEFPAGSVISGETPQIAAKRELSEETGLQAVRLHKLGEGKIPGMKRYIFLAHVPNLQEQTITLQEEETIGYRFVTYEQWIEMIASNRFDVTRGKFYNPAMYDKLAQLVGKPKTTGSPQPTNPENRDITVLKCCNAFNGTRGGFSAPDKFDFAAGEPRIQLNSFTQQAEQEE